MGRKKITDRLTTKTAKPKNFRMYHADREQLRHQLDLTGISRQHLLTVGIREWRAGNIVAHRDGRATYPNHHPERVGRPPIPDVGADPDAVYGNVRLQPDDSEQLRHELSTPGVAIDRQHLMMVIIGEWRAGHLVVHHDGTASYPDTPEPVATVEIESSTFQEGGHVSS